MKRVALRDVQPVPWRNGGGVTRELLAWPSAADWRVRISVADVSADGPFSNFAGLERWFAVLEGAGVRLDIDGIVHEVTHDSPPLRFDGGARVHATLIDGPTVDFNLMAAPGVASLRRRGGLLVVESSLLAATFDVERGVLEWE